MHGLLIFSLYLLKGNVFKKRTTVEYHYFFKIGRLVQEHKFFWLSEIHLDHLENISSITGRYIHHSQLLDFTFNQLGVLQDKIQIWIWRECSQNETSVGVESYCRYIKCFLDNEKSVEHKIFVIQHVKNFLWSFEVHTSN